MPLVQAAAGADNPNQRAGGPGNGAHVSLQATLADRPAVTNGISIGLILLAAVFVAANVLLPRPTDGGQRLFFTVDDGKTTFTDAADRIPPYDHNGQTAVRAYLYQCEGGQPFVAYLERYTDEMKKALTDPSVPKVGPVDREFIIGRNTEIKRPGEGDWVKRSSDAGQKIVFGIKCPDGTGQPKLTLPE